jgi:hypothetical protein
MECGNEIGRKTAPPLEAQAVHAHSIRIPEIGSRFEASRGRDRISFESASESLVCDLTLK